MIRFGARRERSVVCGLLALCALCCYGIGDATIRLELANARRREQLQLLRELGDNVDRLQPGPIAELDGLFGRRLAVVSTPFGRALAFSDRAPAPTLAEVAR